AKNQARRAGQGRLRWKAGGSNFSLGHIKVRVEVAMRRLLEMITVISFGVVPALTCAQDQRPTTQSSILNAPGETVRVQLLDGWSGQPIANADIKVESNNGIVCRTAPCPNNSKQWAGRSDDAGRVTIPRAVLQFNTYVSTE